jgi:nucleotide-sensitive chloride channel 1A
MSPSGSKGFTVPYPSITLHAISRSDSGPFIYCQIDKSLAENEGEPEHSEDDEVVDLIEMSLIPAEPTSGKFALASHVPIIPNACVVEAIFEALSLCASLHPDPNFDEDEEDEDAFIDANGGDFEVFDGSNEQELSEVGRVRSEFVNNSRYAPY